MGGQNIKRLTATALLLALALVLTIVESLVWQPTNGVKLGLSNIVIMFALTSLGGGSAVSIGALKSGFVFLTRGMTAGILSFGGFLLSICVMILLLRLFRGKVSYLLLSVCGALAHNLGQLLIISLLYDSALALYYLPILGIAGVITGAVTAILLRLCLPILQKITVFR